MARKSKNAEETLPQDARRLFVDVETGGLSSQLHGITQIAAQVFSLTTDPETGETTLATGDKFHCKVQPIDWLQYDPEALRMQGETRATLMEEGLSENEAFLAFSEFAHEHLSGQVDGLIWAHEAHFDWSFVRALASRGMAPGYQDKITVVKPRINWTCSKHLFRALKGLGVVPEDQKENLRYIAEYYGIEFPEAEQHRPSKDIEIAMLALPKILGDYNAYFRGTV